MKRWCCLLGILLLMGCSRARFRVNTHANANGGGSMYFIVQEASRLEFQRTNYDHITQAIANSDPSLLKSVVLIPGSRRRVVVKTGGKSVGVYVMFSDPSGPDWKLYCAEPCRGKQRVDVMRSRIQ